LNTLGNQLITSVKLPTSLDLPEANARSGLSPRSSLASTTEHPDSYPTALSLLLLKKVASKPLMKSALTLWELEVLAFPA